MAVAEDEFGMIESPAIRPDFIIFLEVGNISEFAGTLLPKNQLHHFLIFHTNHLKTIK